MDGTRVVVGYDGSAQAGLAVVVAAEVPGDEFSRSPDVDRAARRWAESVASDAVDVLVTASGDAALLVVGSRGHGSFTGALLGSVAYALTSRSSCPVVVVRGEGSLTPGAGHPVVVGVDGLAAATVALDTAADSERAADAVAHEAADRARARRPGLAVRTEVELRHTRAGPGAQEPRRGPRRRCPRSRTPVRCPAGVGQPRHDPTRPRAPPPLSGPTRAGWLPFTPPLRASLRRWGRPGPGTGLLDDGPAHPWASRDLRPWCGTRRHWSVRA